MKIEHIKKVFQTYLREVNPQSAILLNGKWGSGKTFFWKLELCPIAVELGIKPIYLSLNGLSKIEQLEQMLLIKLLPIIRDNDNKMFKAVTTTVTNILNIASKKYLTASLSEILKGVSIDALSLSKYLIVIDDLERCQISIKEVLGYINNYIEHRQTKILILADETNIDKDKKYDSIKEKAIGRILNFNYEVEDILPKLFENKKFTHDDFLFFKKFSDFIIEILKEFDQKNLRIISFFLDQLALLRPFISSAKNDTIIEIIFFTSIITFEFKTGGLTSDDFRNNKGLKEATSFIYNKAIADHFENSKKEENHPPTYAEVFANMYLNQRTDAYFFYESIYQLILSGYLNVEMLQSELLSREPEIPIEVKALNDFFKPSFREWTTEVFNRLTTEIRTYSSQGKYSIYKYSSIASFYFYFSKNQILDISISEVYSFIREGLSNVSRTVEDINDSELENLLHFATEDPDVQIIRNEIEQIHKEIKKKVYINQGEKLIIAIRTEDVIIINDLFYSNRFDSKLFIEVSGEKLGVSLLATSNQVISNFSKLIESRYNSINIGQFLSDDIEVLSELSKAIMNNNIQEQPKKFNLIELSDTINKKIEHLKNTR